MAPHHGRDSGEPALCESGFRPRFVVFSDWRDYSQARYLYEAGGARVFSTVLDGAIEVEVNEDGTGRYRTYRKKKWLNFSTIR